MTTQNIIFSSILGLFLNQFTEIFTKEVSFILVAICILIIFLFGLIIEIFSIEKDKHYSFLYDTIIIAFATAIAMNGIEILKINYLYLIGLEEILLFFLTLIILELKKIYL